MTNKTSNIDYIINLCIEISEQGKTPSIALIRSMSEHSLAIPEVVKGLQHWRSNPSVRPKTQTKQKASSSATNQSLQQRVTQLEKQVASIMQELSKLSDEKKR